MTVIQFDDAAQFRGTSVVTDRYVEDGFSFTSGTYLHPGIRGWTITGDGISVTTPTAFMHQLNGAPFGVLSLDAHGFNAYGSAQATYFTVFGNRADGSQVSATFRTDASFGAQVFKLPETFHAGLVELYWATHAYYGDVYNGGLFAAVDNIVVAAGNRPPAPLADAATVTDGERLVLDVLANDGDPDVGAVLNLQSASAPDGRGSASVQDGKLAFDPGLDFARLPKGASETVTLIYVVVDQHGAASQSTVAVQVTGVNDAPTAAADAASVAAGDQVDVDVLLNDRDLDVGALLTLVEAAAPAGSGAVTIVDGKLRYAPAGMERLAAGETAQVQLSYVVEDEHGARSTATVNVTVTGANDAPTAEPDAGEVTAQGVVEIDVLQNDRDVDAGALLTVVEAAAPVGAGTVSVVNGKLRYAPTGMEHLAAGESVQVTLTYTMQDEHGATATAVVDVTVTGTNDGPTAAADAVTARADETVTVDVLANDLDPDSGAELSLVDVVGSSSGGSASIVDGRLVFAAGSDFIGMAAGATRSLVLSYTMQDEHDAQSSSDVTVTIVGVNDAPIARADGAAVLEDAAVTGSVLVNDSDPDAGDRLSVSGVSSDGTVGAVGGAVQGRYGTLILNADGGYRYAADGDFLDTLSGVKSVTDVFTYEVMDAQGATHTATLTIQVALVDEARTTVGRNKKDVLNGDAGGREYDDTLLGLKGDDELNGGGGADWLYGGEGDDVLNGGLGRDKLFGEEGDDRLDGGAGNDELSGGVGNDLLMGGAGADAFAFGQNSGLDTITDFALGTDRIVLTEGVVAGPLYLYDLDGNGVLDAILQLSGGYVAIMNTGAATAGDFIF